MGGHGTASPRTTKSLRAVRHPRSPSRSSLSSTPHPSRSACLLLLLGRDVELEEDDVAVLDDVLLALGLILARLHQVRGVRVSLRVGLKGRGSG